LEAVVDHLTGAKVDVLLLGNEITTLRTLATGLYTLNAQMIHLESKVPKDREIELYGGSDYHSDYENSLIPCIFNWFGISLINYARLVGFIGGLADNKYQKTDLSNPGKYPLIKETCDDYVDSIRELNPVKKWRNKVTAHFAITDPRKSSDNADILEYSIMHPVGFYGGRFYVGLGNMVITGSGDQLSNTFPQWSITEVYNGLKDRYWPDTIQEDSTQ
jgi:hypothetical protein